MNTDKQHIPNGVFDFVEQYTFAQLTKVQQQEVLQWFDEATYELMHEAALQVKQVIPTVSPKELLLSRFDQKYKNNFASVISMPIALWKAAIFFIVTGFLALGYNHFYPVTDISNRVAALTDTVFIANQMLETEGMKNKIHDTVYINGAAKNETPYPSHMLSTKPVRNSWGKRVKAPQFSDLNIVTIDEWGSTANKPKGNTIEKDSLIHHFNFVKL